MTNISKKYKKLSPREHILMRPSRYLGTATEVDARMSLFDGELISRQNIKMNPAFLKMFDEIITNSADHSLSPDGKHLNKIDVTVNRLTGTITVFDNGGIPVVKHKEYKVYIPDLIFGHLHAGSNFNENEEDEDLINKGGAGSNGEGSKLVNIFSTYFKIETADGKKKFESTYTDNMSQNSGASIIKSTERFTRITWRPDYDRLGMSGLDPVHAQLILTRTLEMAMCAQHIDVTFSGESLDVPFQSYAKMYGQGDTIFDIQDRWNVAVRKSNGDFTQDTFINTTNTYKGGTHIPHIMDAIISRIREHIKKKTKQDIRPADLKNHFHLIADCTIDLPRYNSQTKDDLITIPADYGIRYTPSEAFIKKLLKSDIIESIIEWAMRKQASDEDKEAEKLEKERNKLHLHNIVKYEPATADDRSNCMLLLTEGDSAAKPIQSARLETHGIYPLKGKLLNVSGASKKELVANDEFSELVRILGLSTTSQAIDAIRYGKGICICTDADHDGSHIRGLVFNAVDAMWPKMFDEGLVHVLNTPIAIIRRKRGKDLEFMTQVELEKWIAKQDSMNFEVEYLKGLGSSSDEDFTRYLADSSYMQTVEPLDDEDREALDLAFNPKRADDRKEWIG